MKFACAVGWSWRLVAGMFFLAVFLRAPLIASAQEVSPITGDSGLAQAGPLPELLTEGDWAGEIYGGRSGYVHPFLSLEEYYTDNLFNEPENEEDDFITVISPGVWFSFPAGSRQPLQVTTLNSTPGGLGVTRFPIENRRRLQGYALYRADITEHQDFTGEDNVSQRAEGLLGYSFRGGLSLEVLNIFEIEQEPYGTGDSSLDNRELEEFTSNLFQVLANYRISPKTRVRADFSHYSLDFDNEARNGFREREDKLLSLYGFYRLFPKSSLLLQYEYIDIDYDQREISDSDENRLLTGLVWEVTTRTRGTIKFGYAWRSFDVGPDRDEFIGEVRLDHRFTAKTSAYLLFTRRIEETDVRAAQDILSHRLQAGYRQRLLPRLTGTTDLYYYRDEYQGGVDREDDVYGARLALGYAFRPWLTAGLGYNYFERDSTQAAADYVGNTLYLTLTAAL
ncbi:MAG: outer membrane beta-barrel protein [Desulfuromonadales bacterium]